MIAALHRKSVGAYYACELQFWCSFLDSQYSISVFFVTLAWADAEHLVCKSCAAAAFKSLLSQIHLGNYQITETNLEPSCLYLLTISGLRNIQHIHCFDAVGWVAGRASGQ